ncbi:hypothetical protein C0991_005020, partial [Blastosporella zonata]
FIRSSVSTGSSTPALSSDKSVSDEEDEYTLCAYGDIPVAIPYFIPSLPSNVSPSRDDSEEKTPPQSIRKKLGLNTKHALPSVIRKILPPSPSAAELSPDSDFERVVARLRESHISGSDRSPLCPALALSSPSKSVSQPQPRSVINQKAIDARACAEDDSAKEPQRSARTHAPKPKEKSFRGVMLT